MAVIDFGKSISMRIADQPELDPDEIEAIQEAIRDMENGDRGRNAVQVMAELRAEFGLDRK